MSKEFSNYFAFHYSLLRFIGLGTFRNTGNSIFGNFSNPWYTCYAILQLGMWVFLFTIALWIKIPYIYRDMDRLMLNLTFTVTFTFTFIKIYVFLFRSSEIQEIVHSIEYEMCKFYQKKKIQIKTISISKKLTLFVLSFANLTVIGLIVGGAVQAYRSPKVYSIKHNGSAVFKASDRVLPIPVYLPFEINSDLMYSIAFIYQIFGIMWYGNLVVIINTFMNTILVHLSGRLANLRYVLENTKKIALLRLKYQMKHNQSDLSELDTVNNEINTNQIETKGIEDVLFVPEKEVVAKYSKNTLNNEMRAVLKECIIHHNCIILCVEKLEQIYSFSYLTNVINNLNITCHVMIQIAENDILSIRGGTAIALFFTVVSELLVQCYAGNELSLQAVGIAKSAYNCRWYSCDKYFKRLIAIIMMRAQKPLMVTAGKFVAISNSTFVAIMRGGYFLFTVIRSTRGK